MESELRRLRAVMTELDRAIRRLRAETIALWAIVIAGLALLIALAGK